MNGLDGSAYGRTANVPKEDTFLTETAFGTPVGELLRRYWQPIALSDELTDLPKPVTIMHGCSTDTVAIEAPHWSTAELNQKASAAAIMDGYSTLRAIA